MEVNRRERHNTNKQEAWNYLNFYLKEAEEQSVHRHVVDPKKGAEVQNELVIAFFVWGIYLFISTAGALLVVTVLGVSIHPSSPLRHFAYSGATSSFDGIILPCNDVAADDDEDDRSVDVVEARDLVLDVWHVAGEGEVGDSASEQDNDDLAEKEEEVDDTVEHDHPDQVPHQQVERVPGRLAEAGTLCGDVCRSHNLQNVCLITLTAHMMYAFLLMNLMNFSRQ